MLATSQRQPLQPPSSGRLIETIAPAPKPPKPAGGDHANLATGWCEPSTPPPPMAPVDADLALEISPPFLAGAVAEAVDPLYLFACRVEWEKRDDTTAAWELISATSSPNGDTRAPARALLASSPQLAALGAAFNRIKRPAPTENPMLAPYGIEIIEDCANCPNVNAGYFCHFSEATRTALNLAGHRSILPAGAVLFVEGQSPRGMFIICSGRVNLSTSSREGKTLILKTAEAGEALGISAAISGMGYESTAETATPCQLTFVDRQEFLDLMQAHGEVGLHTAQCLSRDFQSAYRDIHDLVLTRSSSGKLARFLLSCVPDNEDEGESRIHASMTHEEMAQRIGASRETVTRLLGDLRKKQLIRLDGPTLVIRDRNALEAMAV